MKFETNNNYWFQISFGKKNSKIIQKTFLSHHASNNLIWAQYAIAVPLEWSVHFPSLPSIESAMIWKE